MRYIPIVVIVVLAALLASLTVASPSQAAPVQIPGTCQSHLAPRLCAIHWHHHRANIYRQKANLRPLGYHWRAEAHPGLRGWLLIYWIHVQVKAKKQLKQYLARSSASPWSASWYKAAMCVHSHEGAWNDNTGNGYYGGMQMDASFEAAYGPEFLARYGEAGNWPPHDQLLAAYRAWKTRGWTPWPNTAAMCGLL